MRQISEYDTKLSLLPLDGALVIAWEDGKGHVQATFELATILSPKKKHFTG